MNNYIVEWSLEPLESPKILKKCAKCGKIQNFINSNCFRINANENLQDIRLIYHCEKCNTTYNLSVLERTKISDIDPIILEKYKHNDSILARKISLDKSILKSNNIIADWNQIPVHVNKSIISSSTNKDILIIKNNFNLNIRIDKLLSNNSSLSRKKIIDLFQSKEIICNINSKKNTSFNEIVIYFKKKDLLTKFI